MQENELSVDIYHYVEDLVHKNGQILTGIGVLTLFIGINVGLIFYGEGSGSVFIMLIAALSLPFAYQYWFKNTFRLARFTVSVAKDYSLIEVGIAPLHSVKKFQVMPRRYLRNPDLPAPVSVVEEVSQMALAFSDLRNQLQTCELQHGTLTNHDAANLLLLQEGLRAAQNPLHIARITLPDSENSRLHA
jgi:hypothetical protein